MADDLKDAVERNANKQGLELLNRDLDKPQLSRPSSDQYMREKGYPNRGDVPNEYRTGKPDAPTKSSGWPLMDALGFNKGGMVKHGSATRVTCKRKG